MQQSFDARFYLDKGAVIDDPDDPALHQVAHRVAVGDRRPRILQEMLAAEADALALAVDPQYVNVDLFTNAHHLFGMVHALPGQLGYVDEAIGAAEIDKCAKIAPARDPAAQHVSLIELIQQLAAAALLPHPVGLAVREYQPAAAAVHLDNLNRNGPALRFGDALLALVLVHARVDKGQMRSRDEAAQSTKGGQGAAAVVARKLCLKDLAAFHHFLRLNPVFVKARQMQRDLQAIRTIDADDIDGYLVVDSQCLTLGGVQLVQVRRLDDAVALQAQIDDDTLRRNRDDDCLPDVADLRPFIIMLAEQILHFLEKVSILRNLIVLIHSNHNFPTT